VWGVDRRGRVILQDIDNAEIIEAVHARRRRWCRSAPRSGADAAGAAVARALRLARAKGDSLPVLVVQSGSLPAPGQRREPQAGWAEHVADQARGRPVMRADKMSPASCVIVQRGGNWRCIE
jgi:hypothetical protein